MIKKTPFYDKHLECGGKIIEFFGWALPLEYSGILKEAKATRTTCALFDVSHMGRLAIRGKDALSFLQVLTTNDISVMEEGDVQYNLVLTSRGTVVDDLLVHDIGNEFRCVVNASNKEKVFTWLLDHKKGNVDIIDETPDTALLSLQGPYSAKVMETVLQRKLTHLKYMHLMTGAIAGIPCVISRTGYTGEDGFEISTQTAFAQKLWKILYETGKDYKMCLAGLGARDILRIEAGYPLYGHEIDEEINPLEASLGWVVKVDTKEFIGKEKLVNFLRGQIKRKRVGFIMKERGVPRQGYSVYNAGGEEIGKVTSGTYSPNINKFIGMALIAKEHSQLTTLIKIEIRGKLYEAYVTALPFVPYRHK